MRIEQWEATQDNLKLQMQRQLFGLHMPMRILMERKLVSQVRSVMRACIVPHSSRHLCSQNSHMPALSQSNLHLDILMGRDEMLECPDFMMPGMYSYILSCTSD